VYKRKCAARWKMDACSCGREQRLQIHNAPARLYGGGPSCFCSLALFFASNSALRCSNVSEGLRACVGLAAPPEPPAALLLGDGSPNGLYDCDWGEAVVVIATAVRAGSFAYMLGGLFGMPRAFAVSDS
jgi:hypothetical protein